MTILWNSWPRLIENKGVAYPIVRLNLTVMLSSQGMSGGIAAGKHQRLPQSLSRSANSSRRLLAICTYFMVFWMFA